MSVSELVETSTAEYDCRKHDGIPEPEKTGYFRDGQRRIDFVLVMQESFRIRTETIKMEYLASVVNAGLQIELEVGVLPTHRNLVYIKVHAPPELVEEYGEYQDAHKPFKSSHLNHMRKNNFLVGAVVACNTVVYEKQYIKFIRREYPGPLNYSTQERSRIVYRILLAIPFGKPENYFGLYRMMENNLILSAYALHDGPYFYIKGQDPTTVNGRQALFLNWVGHKNLLKSQPINLIQEYLGTRVAFLFSFYERINRMLFILALISLPVTMMMYQGDQFDKVINNGSCTKYDYNFSEWYLVWKLKQWTSKETTNRTRTSEYYGGTGSYWWRPWWYQWDAPILIFDDIGGRYIRPSTYIFNSSRYTWYWTSYVKATSYVYIFKYEYRHKKWVQTPVYRNLYYTDMPVCPVCKDFSICPFVNLTEYCQQVKIKTALDSIYCILFAFFVCSSGVLSYILWQRYEKYLYWLWETNEHEAEKCMRPEFLVEHKKSMLKGMKKVAGICAKFLTRLLLTSLVLVSYIFVFIPCLVALKYAMLKATLDFQKDVGNLRRTYFILLILAMTNALTIIFLEKFGELVSYKFVDYKNYRAEDDYERSLVVKFFGFSVMFNFSLIMFFAFLKGQAYTYPNDYDRWVLPLGLGMMNCGPLSCIDELFIIFLGTIISKLLFKNFFKIFKSRRTDYNQGKFMNRSVPCWEREYVLRDCNDAVVMRKFNDIFIYQAYATMFVYVCPPITLLIYLNNVWDIREFAKDILLHSKRPTLLKTWSLGKWKMVFFALPYMAAITNALTIALQSHLVDYSFFASFMKDGRFFVDYAMAFFNTTDYALNHTKKTILDKMSTTPKEDYDKITVRGSTEWVPRYCLFPGKWNREVASYAEGRVFDQTYAPTPVKWWINWYQLAFFLIFVITSVVIGLVLHVCISESPSDIEETMALEDIVMRYQQGEGVPGAGGDAKDKQQTKDKKNV